MFTVIFAVARTVGWISQWKEMTEVSTKKISRPRQLYVGNNHREYIDITKEKNKNKCFQGKLNKFLYLRIESTII